MRKLSEREAKAVIKILCMLGNAMAPPEPASKLKTMSSEQYYKEKFKQKFKQKLKL